MFGPFLCSNVTISISISMKLKDLPANQSLGGVRFRYPKDGQLYYWLSQWEKGVWGKKDMGSERIYPLFCENLSEALEWEVVPEEKKSS